MYDIPLDEFVKTLMFADDTSIYATSDDARLVQYKMNAHLVRLHKAQLL